MFSVKFGMADFFAPVLCLMGSSGILFLSWFLDFVFGEEVQFSLQDCLYKFLRNRFWPGMLGEITNIKSAHQTKSL